jgi:D-sedoheptulose 7-phosphate isomerase
MDPKGVADSAMKDIADMILNVDQDEIVRVANLLLQSDVIVLFGNGGSYSTASHMACDLMLRTRAGAVVHAIGDNAAAFSAYVNDFSYEEGVAMEMERFLGGKPGVKTVLFFSTSGESKNITRAAKTAKQYSCTVVAFFGKHLIRIKPFADHVFKVDGVKSGRIESVHSAICHTIVDTMWEIRKDVD